MNCPITAYCNKLINATCSVVFKLTIVFLTVSMLMKLQHRDNLFSSLISSPCLILVFFSAVHISVLPHVPSCLPVCSVFFNCTQTVGLKELSHCLGLVPRLLSCANRTHLGSHLGLQVQPFRFRDSTTEQRSRSLETSAGVIRNMLFSVSSPRAYFLKLLLS